MIFLETGSTFGASPRACSSGPCSSANPREFPPRYPLYPCFSQPGRTIEMWVRHTRSVRSRGICVQYLNSVGMKRPVGKFLDAAEILLRQLGSVDFAFGVDLQAALANFPLPAMFAEHVFYEPDDIPWHDNLPVWQAPLPSAFDITN